MTGGRGEIRLEGGEGGAECTVNGGRGSGKGSERSPSRPRYITNSVRVVHLVEFMWMWCLLAMNSFHTTLAWTRLWGWLEGQAWRRDRSCAQSVGKKGCGKDGETVGEEPEMEEEEGETSAGDRRDEGEEGGASKRDAPAGGAGEGRGDEIGGGEIQRTTGGFPGKRERGAEGEMRKEEGRERGEGGAGGWRRGGGGNRGYEEEGGEGRRGKTGRRGRRGEERMWT